MSTLCENNNKQIHAVFVSQVSKPSVIQEVSLCMHASFTTRKLYRLSVVCKYLLLVVVDLHRMAKSAKMQEQLTRELIRLKRKACRNGAHLKEVHQVYLNSCSNTGHAGSATNKSSAGLADNAVTGDGDAEESNKRVVGAGATLEKKLTPKSSWKKRLTITTIPVLIGILLGISYQVDYGWQDFVDAVRETPCIIDNNFFIMEMSRPLAPCTMCQNLTHVPHYDVIPKDKFLTEHAYSGRPAVISGATTNWTAMDNFSFWFFRDLYRKHPGSFDTVEEECQFFPYNTDFESLEDAFNMSDDQAAMKDGEKPWYFGW